jgi:hypothetical protein
METSCDMRHRKQETLTICEEQRILFVILAFINEFS